MTEVYKTVKPRGRILKQYVENKQLSILNLKDDTHIDFYNQSIDVLDMVLIKNVTWEIEVQVKSQLSSDYLPLILEMKLHAAELQTIKE